MCPSPVPEGYVRGPIFFDGGADFSLYDDYARNAFWNLAGGYGARIVVLTANENATDADYGYAAAYRKLESTSVQLIVVGSRGVGHDPAVLHVIQESTGIFLSGGHPLRWSTRIGGTPLATAIRRANAVGKAVGAVGGSAAFLGNHVLVYGHDHPCLAPGLGLTNRIVVAGHFDPQQHGDLLRMAIASNPYLVGIGLSAAAAVVRRADSLLEAVGLAEVLVVEGNEMTSTNLADWQPGRLFEAPGLRSVPLPPEHLFDLERRAVVAPAKTLPRMGRYNL
jgi:cyanophycinase